MSRRPHFCPACRRPFPPLLVVHGPVRQRVVDLIANRPDGITRAELLDLVYADDPNVGGVGSAAVRSLARCHSWRVLRANVLLDGMQVDVLHGVDALDQIAEGDVAF